MGSLSEEARPVTANPPLAPPGARDATFHWVFLIMATSVLALAGYRAQADDGIKIDAARAAAIHECSVAAQRYPETTFSSLEFEVYRACMARHGQVE